VNVLTGSELKKMMPLYDLYDSNQAIIYSIFENQFEGYVYTDDKDNPHWAVLRTPFLQHFIAGTPAGSCEVVIDEILFDRILAEQTEKEIAVFAVSEKWHDILNGVFENRKGVSDRRKIFEFNHDKYMRIHRRAIPDDVVSMLDLRKCSPESHIDTWSARIYVKDREVSHCNAFMIGKGMAEIDVGTDEGFQNKGYATQAAILLIDKLIETDLTPAWSTWPFRVESQHIAKKLGFDEKPDAKAWIWMENMESPVQKKEDLSCKTHWGSGSG